MNITLLPGYPDAVGHRRIWCGYGHGMASYVQSGDILSVPAGTLYIDSVSVASDSTGTYEIWPVTSGGVGSRKSWILLWVVRATGVEVAVATNLSASNVQLWGFGGKY